MIADLLVECIYPNGYEWYMMAEVIGGLIDANIMADRKDIRAIVRAKAAMEEL